MSGKIKKNDINEIKSLAKPPEGVIACLSAVAVLLGEKDADDWKTCQKMLADKEFIQKCDDFDVSSVTGDTMQKLAKYTSREDFTVEIMKKKSPACVGLLSWVLAAKGSAE